MKRVLFALTVLGLFLACQVENINYTKPVMVTYEPQNVLSTSASLGGYAAGEGGQEISEYGIVYSTGTIPTTADNKVAIGERVGEFYQNFELFEPGTTYNYRTYGINQSGTGYGETYSFTTTEEAPCDPATDNFVDIGTKELTINYVDMETNDTTEEGNIRFTTTASWDVARIILIFNEIDKRLPLTGTYTTTHGFDIGGPYSQGLVKVEFEDFNSAFGGSSAAPGKELYIENNDGVLTFIFCDLELQQHYTLNGKFTYAE